MKEEIDKQINDSKMGVLAQWQFKLFNSAPKITAPIPPFYYHQQMMQYAICSEDLSEIEQHLNNSDSNEPNSIAPDTENIELEDEAEGSEDLNPDFIENYDLCDDLGIPSKSLNDEPLILNDYLIGIIVKWSSH